MYKPLSDSTLMGMTKKEIIEHLRVAEHNHKVCEEQIDQQYKNCMELLKKERTDAIEEYKLRILNAKSNMVTNIDQAALWVGFKEQVIDIAEQLKKQKNDSSTTN